MLECMRLFGHNELTCYRIIAVQIHTNLIFKTVSGERRWVVGEITQNLAITVPFQCQESTRWNIPVKCWFWFCISEVQVVRICHTESWPFQLGRITVLWSDCQNQKRLINWNTHAHTHTHTHSRTILWCDGSVEQLVFLVPLTYNLLLLILKSLQILYAM